MVEGTGLENQRRKRPQVRILSFPPGRFEKWPLGHFLNLLRQKKTGCEPKVRIPRFSAGFLILSFNYFTDLAKQK